MGRFSKIVEELIRDGGECQPIPLHVSAVREFANSCLEIIFPQLADQRVHTALKLEAQVDRLADQLNVILTSIRSQLPESADTLTTQFISELPKIKSALKRDAEALFQGDPAARSLDEVILAYPGLFAIGMYRIANRLHQRQVPLVPRIVTEFAHQLTGVDIHPGATIGDSFFIDHGTGIVIGETSVIGDNVKLYQGVALGAMSVDKGFQNKKRHPTIEDNVIIYANATILGGETVVGHHSIIGGNVWLTESVPPHSTVFHKGEVHVRPGDGRTKR